MVKGSEIYPISHVRMTHVRFARVCQFYRQLTLQLIRGYHISLGGTIFQSRCTSFSTILYVDNVLEKTEK